MQINLDPWDCLWVGFFVLMIIRVYVTLLALTN